MSIRLKALLFFLCSLTVLSLCGNIHAESDQQSAPDKPTGTITGRIMVKDGVPLAFGQIMLYDALTGPPPLPHKYERTPDISKTIDAEGRFTVVLPEGRYYLGAVRRMSGERFGPPQEGDYIFRSLDDQGKPKEYLVQAGQILDLGTISEAIPLKAKDFSARRVTTAIKGYIIDMDGKPVEGAIVVAFVKPTIGGKPLFVSDRSDKEGKYILRVTEGTYYLRARNSFAAGPPEPGQIVGYYGDGTPAPVVIEECEIKEGVNFRVIMFPGRGPMSGTVPSTQ
ncbi:MAG: carboxypeptidase regulatory-like domain-containing protein [Nitrospiraceae bacterium]|nr:MAG: carboxypeptidase regulatory-like domain-containing protein [Nitrospiraceae bacterium]